MFIEHKKQNTHWAACNSEIIHSWHIYSEDIVKQKCKDDNSKLINKELYTESITAKKS